MNLLYFANPMCSWCWGFSPVVMALQAQRDKYDLTVATGPLGASNDKPMRDKDREAVREHWQHVHEMTGQPFDHGFFERETFIYDTEPACRALALLRASYPALAPVFLQRLQERFYAHNDDITDPDRLAAIAGDFGQDPTEFRRNLDDPQLIAALAHEWRQTASMGVTGYPMLLALKNGKAHALAIGCQSLDHVEEQLRGIEAENSP
ncbi:MAG: DsbA family protein [Geminicoccaceae bacterium]